MCACMCVCNCMCVRLRACVGWECAHVCVCVCLCMYMFATSKSPNLFLNRQCLIYITAGQIKYLEMVPQGRLARKKESPSQWGKRWLKYPIGQKWGRRSKLEAFSNCGRPHQLVMDSTIIFLDSVRVGQFAKKSRSESFVRSFVQSRFR